jgi:RNA polymerase sigma factor (sigma-70 family)
MRPKSLSRQSPEQVLETLYRHHLRDTFGYALALLGSPADAEDATQATFLNAYRALQQGERPRHANRWLRAIALNVCREHFRRESRRPGEVSLEDDPGELVVEPEGPAIADVIRALRHLPFNQRSALVMREFEGRSLAEIARRLGVTSSAVETLLFRGRRALREQLDSSLSCAQAEQAISHQLDGALPRRERGVLRAHLRECPECASLARRLRAQRSTLKSLALVPVPASLAWSKLAAHATAAGGSSMAATASIASGGLAGLAIKTAGGTMLAVLAVGAGYATLQHHAPPPPPHAVTAPARPRIATAGRAALTAAEASAGLTRGTTRPNGPASKQPAPPAQGDAARATRRAGGSTRRGALTPAGHARSSTSSTPTLARSSRGELNQTAHRFGSSKQTSASSRGQRQARRPAPPNRARQRPATSKPNPATPPAAAYGEPSGQRTRPPTARR